MLLSKFKSLNTIIHFGASNFQYHWKKNIASDYIHSISCNNFAFHFVYFFISHHWYPLLYNVLVTRSQHTNLLFRPSEYAFYYYRCDPDQVYELFSFFLFCLPLVNWFEIELTCRYSAEVKPSQGCAGWGAHISIYSFATQSRNTQGEEKSSFQCSGICLARFCTATITSGVHTNHRISLAPWRLCNGVIFFPLFKKAKQIAGLRLRFRSTRPWNMFLILLRL